MFRKCVFFLLLITSAAWAQGAPDPAPPEKQNKPDADPTLGSVASTGLNQKVVPASALSNGELLSRARTVYVLSDTVFVKKEYMEKSLLRQKALDELGLHVVQDRQNADVILEVKRIPFQNKFPFTITDRVSTIVLMYGQVDDFPHKVPDKIASQIADHLKEIKTKTENKKRR